jgi:hypothetical protein
MNDSTHHDVVIDGHRYKIGPFSARFGSYVALQLLPRLTDLNEEEFGKFQDRCLAVCGRYNNHDVPIPVVTGDGIWAPELDAFTATELIKEALQFNLGPIMSKLKEKAETEQVARSSQPNSKE